MYGLMVVLVMDLLSSFTPRGHQVTQEDRQEAGEGLILSDTELGVWLGF